MKYKKEPFTKNGKEMVRIKILDDNYFYKYEGKEVRTEEFEVYSKNKIYYKIKKEEPINLNHKYIEKFSLEEYRKINKLEKNKILKLKDLRIYFSFFESGKDGQISFSNVLCEGVFSIGGTIFGTGEDNCKGNFKFNFIEVKEGDFSVHCVFDDGDVYFESCNFGKGNFRLTDTIFGQGIVTFRETDFGDGDCYFTNVNFGDGDIYIGGGFPATKKTIFGDGKVNFDNAIFGKGNKIFAGANFGTGNVSFYNTNFGSGDLNFDSATFDGEVIDFTESKLKSGKISFRGTKFKRSDRLSFRNSKFGKSPCEIIGINFNGKKISFRNAQFSTIVIWSDFKGDLDLRVKKAKLINLSDSTIYGNIELNRDNLLRVIPKVKELQIIDTKIYGKIYIDYDEFGLESAINNQKYATYKQKASQFRIFKENFRSLGQYDDEDKAYYWFKYYQIRADAEIKEFDNFKEKCKKKLIYGFKRIAFEWIGKYGTSPGRVFLTMIIAVLIFAGFYSFLPPINYQNHSPLFHSTITFLTIGYGTDYINLNLLGKILSGIEGFLGLFLIAYFTISFARKVTR